MPGNNNLYRLSLHNYDDAMRSCISAKLFTNGPSKICGR